MPAGSEDVKKLQLRIVELENRLKQMMAAREPTDISVEEVKAYRKVRDVLAADWGDFCGINDCMRCIVTRCFTNCIVTRCIVRCIVECTCGPCSPGRLGTGGGGRFSDLGE